MKDTEKSLQEILGSWEQSMLTYLPKVFLAVIVLMLFFILAKLARRLSFKIYSKTIKVHLDVANIIASVFYFLFIVSGIFIALQIVGLESVLANVLAGAGIIGIIAGFAFKDIASNIFSGLLLKIQHPFKTGEWVKINNNYGEVLEVGWVTTKIKTIPGPEVFVPNQLIYNNTFINYSTFKQRRVTLKNSISSINDLERVKDIAIDEVKKTEELLSSNGVDFYYTNIESSTFLFKLRFWIKFETDDDFRKAKSNIIMRIKKRFEQENIK